MAQAPSPRTLRRLPLATDSYQHLSPPLTTKRLLNLMAEQEPSDARSEVALLSTPGLALAATYGSGPIWAMNDDLPGRLYVVSGGTLYRVEPTGAPINLGSVGTTDSLHIVSIAVGPIAVVVCVPPRAYVAGHSDLVMHQIGGNFPGAASVAYLAGRFVFTGVDNDTRFFASQLLDPTTYDAFDFAYSDALPNVVRRVVAHRGDLWMLGEAGVQVWAVVIDPGTGFPFAPQPGGVIPYGSASPRSVAQADGSVWWVGTDCIVYRSDGYQGRRVSDHSIEAWIRSESAPSVATALTMSQDGHTIYALTFADTTKVYDIATKLWHDRSSDANGNGRWRPQCSALRSDIVLLGDYRTGQVWSPDPALGSDAGVFVERMAILPPLWADAGRGFMHRVEVEMETGSTGDVTLDWSDDGGFTYGTQRVMSSGSAFEHRRRVFTDRLGSFRQRSLRLTLHNRAVIYAVDAQMDGVAG